MSRTDNSGRSLPIGSHHYRAYVGPPENYDLVAAMQFNLLTNLGLREFHYLLDVGCGSLRAGRLFIPYLLPGHYYGIEPESWLIEEGIKNELGQDLLRIKQPVFSHESNFDCLRFDRKFDFVVAQSVFSHAARVQISQCFSNVEKCLQPTGVMAATFVKGTTDYQGERWIYPDCITYTVNQMKRLAAGTGLVAEPIDWPHPNGQTWLFITRPNNRIRKGLRLLDLLRGRSNHHMRRYG
jgi:SAM-dependent methyltransferase